MKTKWCKVLILLIMAGFVGVASADNIWNGNALDGLWGTGGNWSLGVPPAIGQGNIIINDQTNGSLITIDSSVMSTVDGDVFGPEWGIDLDIDGGSLVSTGFAFAPIGASDNPSVISVFNGGVLTVPELLIGDNWWFATAPFAELHVYDTASVTATGWCWLGGLMSIHGGSVYVTGGFNMNASLQNNAHIDIEAGSLTLAYGDATEAINTWISTGELTAYGLTPGQGADILIDTATVPGSTIVTAVYYYPATNPTPADGSTQVGTLQGDNAVDVTLNWWAGADPNAAVNGNVMNPDILTHYVYVSGGPEDPNLYYVDAVDHTDMDDPNAMLTVTDLVENTQYFWTIQEGLDNGTGVAYAAGDPNNIEGPVWSFTTKAAVPAITDPVDDTADPNSTFSVVDENNAATAYQWYKEGDPNPLTDTGAYSGATTAKLTVTNATLAEEGLYYCIASNGPHTDQSESAYLWTQRLMGHWEFEGDLTDSIADSVATAPAHDGAIGTNTVVGGGDPNFVSDNGPDGSGSIQFFNDGDYVAIDDADFFNFHRLGFTVSFWYKVNTPILGEGLTWRLPLSKLDGGIGGYLFGIDAEERQWALFFTNPDDEVDYWADGYADTNGDGENDIDLADGQWHMLTAVYNPAVTTYTIFTDGDENESIVYDLSANPLPAAPLSIGGRSTEQAIDGFIDDVRIYSKVLTPLEIADLYVTFATDKWVCVEDPDNPLAAFDFVQDCIINLADFAEFANKWLECQRYPDTFCTE